MPRLLTRPDERIGGGAAKAGIKLCFYYSQSQDWHEPDAVGNDWDFKADSKKDFAKYLKEKVEPQVTELLTNYGSDRAYLVRHAAKYYRKNKARSLSISCTGFSPTVW